MFCTIFLRKICTVLHFFTTNLHCFTKFTYEFWLNHRSHGHDATNIVGFSSMCWIELFTLAIPNFDLDDFHVLNAFVVCNVFICLYQPLRVLCHQISKSSICNYSCRVLWAILPLVNKILYVYIYIWRMKGNLRRKRIGHSSGILHTAMYGWDEKLLNISAKDLLKKCLEVRIWKIKLVLSIY